MKLNRCWRGRNFACPLFLLAVASGAETAWIAPPDPRLEVDGLPWFAENAGEFIRLPLRLKDTLPKAVWNLGNSPSGGRIRFRTDSNTLAIRVEYPSPPNMTNMHALGGERHPPRKAEPKRTTLKPH